MRKVFVKFSSVLVVCGILYFGEVIVRILFSQGNSKSIDLTERNTRVLIVHDINIHLYISHASFGPIML